MHVQLLCCSLWECWCFLGKDWVLKDVPGEILQLPRLLLLHLLRLENLHGENLKSLLVFNDWQRHVSRGVYFSHQPLRREIQKSYRSTHHFFFCQFYLKLYFFGQAVSLFPQATINIVFDRVGKTDPVTRGIEITVNYLGIQFDVRPTHMSHMSLWHSLRNVWPPCRNDNHHFVTSPPLSVSSEAVDDWDDSPRWQMVVYFCSCVFLTPSCPLVLPCSPSLR